MSHDDFDFEPVKGLPAPLPAGESLVWQGSPGWRALAVRAYHTRKVALYFAALIVWRVLAGVRLGHDTTAIALSSAFIMALGAVAIGVLTLLAWLNSRSTVYSITSRRLLIRHGVAVPMTINIPFSVIESADLRRCKDGTGEIYFTVERAQRVAYLINWPHLQPAHFTRPCPAFRALADASVAAERLAGVLGTEPGHASLPTNATPAGLPEFVSHTAAA
jgi:hypothetical protein